MAKSSVTDKCRTGIPNAPGLSRVVNQEAWGAAQAVKWTGQGVKTYPPPKDQSQPQFKEDQPLKKNDGEIPVSSWLRGGPNESGKPRR